MNDETIRRVNDAADRVANRLNEAMKLPTSSTAQVQFKEVPVVDIAAMLSDIRIVIGALRAPLRSGIEQLALAANSPLRATGLSESLDIHDGKHVQIEAGRQAAGKHVLYVHIDGVTRLRTSGFQSLSFSDKRERVAPSTGDPRTDPEPFDEFTGPLGPMSS